MKTKKNLLSIIVFIGLNIPTNFHSQAYQRTSKNIGLIGGFSKGIDRNQTSIQIGIGSQINRFLIPELNYRITTNTEDSRISSKLNDIHFLNPAIQLRTRFLRNPARKVRGICTQEFLDFGVTPEYFFVLNPNQIESETNRFFALRTSLILFRYKSGMRKSQKAWSFKIETFYRHTFGEFKPIGNEFGLNLRITKFQVYNFLR